MEMEGIEYAPDKQEPTRNFDNPAFTQNSNELGTLSKLKENLDEFPKDIFVVQLTGKVRNQAKQLQEKENYIILCEKRILELLPGHPLPITSGHLGKCNKNQSLNDLKKLISQRDEELEICRKHNEKLKHEINHLYKAKKSTIIPSDKLSELEKSKQSLEESLRAEVFINEEQRSYIKVLKEVVETKLENLGISKLLSQTRNRTQKMDILKQILHPKNIVEDQRDYSKTKKLEELQKKFDSVVNDLNVINDINKKLEEEKDLTMNYIKELRDKQLQMSNSIENLNELNKKQSEEKILCDRQIEELTRNLQNSNAKLESITQNYNIKLNEFNKIIDDHPEFDDIKNFVNYLFNSDSDPERLRNELMKIKSTVVKQSNMDYNFRGRYFQYKSAK